MKISHSKVLSKRLLLAFSLFAIILTLVAFVVRYAVSQKLNNVVTQVHKIESKESKPERVLLLMHQAENDFQQSFLSAGNLQGSTYKTKLLQAFNKIDTILSTSLDTSKPYMAQYVDIKSWYTKKIALSDRYNILKSNIDSFLMIYSEYEENMSNGNYQVASPRPIRSSQSNVDTLRKNIASKKRKLMGRIKDAILNKNERGSETIIKVHEKTTVDSLLLLNQNPFTSNGNSYQKTLQQLRRRNADMKIVQQNLLRLNNHISTDLEEIVSELKTIDAMMGIELKNAAIKSYTDTIAIIDNFCVTALILVLIFAVLLIVYVIKLNRAEQSLLNENERAIDIARQKMDLLQHMSHEIRNPISNIQGFLHIFGQTDLSPKQSEMLNAISLSSRLLLNTVNDVLAAAKMENSEFTLSTEPFNPYFVLKQTVETMRFSAEKKNLNLIYEFTGDKEIMLFGDQFRLEQILINLLSNAVKYTNTGSINVKAILQDTGEKQQLQVIVADTGIGIAANEQINLFSKYYQASSAKGKVGTGLGLYICKSFIELQGGTITVTSTEGKGSIFSFQIPYTVKTESDKLTAAIKKPVSLLNGINILAVDDNQFSLKFLKMITFNWNVNLFFAENGIAALNILEKENISVVFTDINMPEMNGFELLTAIRKLPQPKNNIPVIVMNGDQDRYDEKALLNKGFSAVGNKPIVEMQMAELIVRVMEFSRP